MPRYLRIADKIYKNIQNDKGFMDDPTLDLRVIMKEIRKEIQGTDLKLLYNYIDFETLMMCSEHSKLKLDLSIIPKSKNSQEFILWLASLIERITKGQKQPVTTTQPPVNLPLYVYDDYLEPSAYEDRHKPVV